jgi:glycosyltransferase involved in cell wall biosynthesis
MPCYNAAEFVSDSVQAVLDQSISDLELLVVDDSSKDRSRLVLEDLARRDARIRLILHEKNLGASRTRNDGIRAATGVFLGFCDADDIWKQNKLERQIDLLNRNPGSDIAYCDSEIIDEKGQLTGQLFSQIFPNSNNWSGNIFEGLSSTNFINMQTVLLRRRSFSQESLLFDEQIKWVEDWWQWVRLARDHLFVFEREPLALYRVHPQSTRLTQKRGITINRWKVCKRSLRAHPEMPDRIKAQVWYQMGVSLYDMGRNKLARAYLARAMRLALRGGTSPLRLAAMSRRLGLAYF